MLNSGFSHLDKLERVILSGNITSINKYAFYNCVNLTEITVPDVINLIGAYAFYNCHSLTGIDVPTDKNWPISFNSWWHYASSFNQKLMVATNEKTTTLTIQYGLSTPDKVSLTPENIAHFLRGQIQIGNCIGKL